MSEPKTYTQEEVETAMAAWEWVLEAISAPEDHHAKAAAATARILLSRIGTVELRSQLITTVVPAVCASYAAAVRDHGYDDAFDWEYVPWFMENRVAYALEIRIIPGRDAPEDKREHEPKG